MKRTLRVVGGNEGPPTWHVLLGVTRVAVDDGGTGEGGARLVDALLASGGLLLDSADAASDFRHCLELQESETQRSYHVRPHILLGDALAKNKDYDGAREVWRRGFAAFPDSSELAERVALGADRELEDFVEENRSLEIPIDTDFSFLGD